MRLNRFALFGCLLVFLAWGTGGMAEEASGNIAEVGHGTFTLDDNGTMRLFNLSSKTSQYEPTTWRPNTGDKVELTFFPKKNRLVVSKVTMIEPGPSTPTGLISPATAEIVEVGKSGVRAKIESGHIIQFVYGRGVKKLPLGWIPVVGETSLITFHTQSGGWGPIRSFGIKYVVDTMEKVKKDATAEADAK